VYTLQILNLGLGFGLIISASNHTSNILPGVMCETSGTIELRLKFSQE